MAENNYFSPILHRVKSRKRLCTSQDVLDNLRANIEKILNTRLPDLKKYVLRPDLNCDPDYLNNSLLNFGIADIQSLNLGDDSKERRFCESVRLAISRFEPRMSNVKVEMNNKLNSRMINLEVRGNLRIYPFEDISFQSGIEMDSQEFVVD